MNQEDELKEDGDPENDPEKVAEYRRYLAKLARNHYDPLTRDMMAACDRMENSGFYLGLDYQDDNSDLID
jgi:hypothetical protein